MKLVKQEQVESQVRVNQFISIDLKTMKRMAKFPLTPKTWGKGLEFKSQRHRKRLEFLYIAAKTSSVQI